MSRKIMLESRDGINVLELNQRFEALSQLLNNAINGKTPQESPIISSFTNAQHNHQDAAGGGQLTVEAIDSETADDGYVIVSDGAGNGSWSDLASSFTGLSDTPLSYASQALKLLRVNSTPDGIEFAPLPDRDDSIINEVSDYTTTSTSFVDVDATDLSVEVTTNGGDILVFVAATLKQSGTNRVYFELDVNGSPVATEDGVMMWRSASSSAVIVMVCMRLLRGLSADTYTIKLQWKVDAGTATMYAGAGTSGLDVHPQMIALEVL